MVLDIFKFFENASTSVISNELINKMQSDTLICEVSGNSVGLSLEFQVNFNREDTNWITVSVIKRDSYEIVSSVVENGIYDLNIVGISSMRVKINGVTSGTVTVVGKIVGDSNG